MNEKLRKAKQDLKRIDSFCHSRPIPTYAEVMQWLSIEDLTRYDNYAKNVIDSVWAAELILHSLKKSDR
jgi:hypothetical protein